MPLDDTEVKSLAADLKRATDEVKTFAETSTTELKNLGKLTGETKSLADKAITDMTGLQARMDAMEQRQARRGVDADPREMKTLGEQVSEDEGIKSLLASKKGRASVEVKAIISALTTDANGSVGDMIAPNRLDGLVVAPQRRMTIRDLLRVGQTASPSIQFVKETGYVMNAATVSETAGTTKPQSELKTDIVTVPVTTLAHWVLATRQILDDVPMLRAYIDGRLRYGLAFVEEQQILLGGGTGTDLNGLFTQATAYSAPITIADATPIDTLRLAMLQATLAEYAPSGLVMNPADWARIELSKETSGAYLFANPAGMVQPRLWGLPVVATPAMPIDSALVGAFSQAAMLFDRQQATVMVSTEDATNFRQNLVTILAEERLALAVFRPQALVKVDLGFVA